MKNLKKLTFVMTVLLSQTAFAVTAALPLSNQQNLDAQLFDAAIAGNVTQASKLLKAGADVNARYDIGGSQMTPLMKAAQYEHVPMIQLLLQNKADISDTGRVGRNALDWYKMNGGKNSEIIRLLTPILKR